MVSRLGYDGNEGIYFDCTKPIQGMDPRGDDDSVFEEVDPIEVCAELETEISKLKQQVQASERENGKLRTILDPARELIGVAITHHHVNHEEWNEAARRWLKGMPYPAASRIF